MKITTDRTTTIYFDVKETFFILFLRKKNRRMTRSRIKGRIKVYELKK